tara:strand:- start:7759 stop:7905 length:147 start_codon:yes stop_codon:yes gene_type:complete
MGPKDIALEMLNYLNATGQYYQFLEWASSRGFDSDELEVDIETEIEGL